MSLSVNAQNTKTGEAVIYYDQDWKGVESEAFATFVRHAVYVKDSHYKNRFKDYTSSGELCGEGVFVSIDKYDDANSKFEQRKIFDASGAVAFEMTSDGTKEICTEYYPNGVKSAEYTMVDGYINGIVKQYNYDSTSWSEIPYKNGEIDATNSFYYVYSVDGEPVKHDIRTNKKLDVVAPSPTECKTEFEDGLRWNVYCKNGLVVSAASDVYRDYGGRNGIVKAVKVLAGNKGMVTYTRVMLVVKNNSATPLLIDPSTFTAKNISGKKPKDIVFLSLNDYTKTMAGSQKMQSNMNSANETAMAKEMAITSRSQASANAGYNSQSQSSSSSSVKAGAAGGFVASGQKGAAAGGGAAYLKGKSQSKSSSSAGAQYNAASTSETVDASLYTMNMQNARNLIREFDNALGEERDIKLKAYLKPTTVPPFGTYTGYILTSDNDISTIEYNVQLEDVTYPFVIEVSDVRSE